MATDLFNNYYNNPQKQSIYTNLSCPSGSSEDEYSFSINGSEGIISNNKDVLASIDLSKINSSLTEWNTSSKILAPNSITYIEGITSGESYKSYTFGKFDCCLLDKENWLSDIELEFDIEYVNKCNVPSTARINVEANSADELIENINIKLNGLGINVVASLNSFDEDSSVKDLITFTAGEVGYDYYINHIVYFTFDKFGEYMHILEECENMYVPAFKYRNGALKGIVIIPKYPKYNASDISSSMKSLKLVHVKDRVAFYLKNKDVYENYKKHYVDIFAGYFNPNEYANCLCLSDKKYDINDINDYWLNDENDYWVTVSNNAKVLAGHAGGTYALANWATLNNMWTSFGDMYAVVAADDDLTSYNVNLVPGVLIHNPNNFEIKINVITFN